MPTKVLHITTRKSPCGEGMYQKTKSCLNFNVMSYPKKLRGIQGWGKFLWFWPLFLLLYITCISVFDVMSVSPLLCRVSNLNLLLKIKENLWCGTKKLKEWKCFSPSRWMEFCDQWCCIMHANLYMDHNFDSLWYSTIDVWYCQLYTLGLPYNLSS